MSLNPNQKTLDGRCRLAMATEFLFQKPSFVYERLFAVRLGYCLNKAAELSDDNGARPYRHFFDDDPLRLDAQYYLAFRKMFRKLAQKWRAGSDGSDLRWSYDQLQWDWRSFHGKRLKHTDHYTGKYPIRPVPEMLADNPSDFLVKFPTKIQDALCDCDGAESDSDSDSYGSAASRRHSDYSSAASSVCPSDPEDGEGENQLEAGTYLATSTTTSSGHEQFQDFVPGPDPATVSPSSASVSPPGNSESGTSGETINGAAGNPTQRTDIENDASREPTDIESRTESCEDLYLEVLREKVGTKMPRHFWNVFVDRGTDYLEKFHTVVESQKQTSPGRQRRPLRDTEWSVRFLMTMARETCNPSRTYESMESVRYTILHEYDSDALAKGCHKSDKAFFREVLDFFHQKVARSPTRNSGAITSPSWWADSRPPLDHLPYHTITTRSIIDGKVVTWNPHPFEQFHNYKDMDSHEIDRHADWVLGPSPHVAVLDGRCRLVMATEFLFQNYDAVYQTLEYRVKHGYCLNPSLRETWSRTRYGPRELLDQDWHPYFRKMFRKFAKKWIAGSDGTDPRWSYDQFQWDWRSFHAKRLKNMAPYKQRVEGGWGTFPEMLADNPERYFVAVHSKIEDEF
ncbi:unnamed protein product [Amoebophrya sp. A120]|nr:unnamed protein product [Amoebophrya sp. A120]|eukprot:GSA120T00005048001.1